MNARTETQNITHVSQCFSHVLNLVQPSLVDIKGAHSTVKKNSITHPLGVVIITYMFGCASLRVRRVKCSLYSHVNCVLEGGQWWQRLYQVYAWSCLGNLTQRSHCHNNYGTPHPPTSPISVAPSLLLYLIQVVHHPPLPVSPSISSFTPTHWYNSIFRWEESGGGRQKQQG